MIRDDIKKRCTNCGRHPFCNDITDGVNPSCDNRWIEKEKESDTKLDYRDKEIFRFKRLN